MHGWVSGAEAGVRCKGQCPCFDKTQHLCLLIVVEHALAHLLMPLVQLLHKLSLYFLGFDQLHLAVSHSKTLQAVSDMA